MSTKQHKTTPRRDKVFWGLRWKNYQKSHILQKKMQRPDDRRAQLLYILLVRSIEHYFATFRRLKNSDWTELKVFRLLLQCFGHLEKCSWSEKRPKNSCQVNWGINIIWCSGKKHYNPLWILNFFINLIWFNLILGPLMKAWHQPYVVILQTLWFSIIIINRVICQWRS